MSELIVPSAGQRHFQQSLLEHDCSPRFNFSSTDMLTPAMLCQVQEFESQTMGQPFPAPGQHPDWLAQFVDRAFTEVPYYRSLGSKPRTFEAIPPFGREVLADQPWSLVPDSLSLEALTVYTTSGTSASALAIPTHPSVSSMLLVLLDRLLAGKGVRLPRGEGQVAIALVAHQQETLTYASMSHFLGGAAFLKLNLAPHAWRDADHRAAYLRDAAPAVITGSPFAFEKLAEIVPDLRPRALVSSAVALHPGHAASLETRFACPVFDLYSMTEARSIAGRSSDDNDFALLSPDLYVEILGHKDEALPPGEVGEIVLTGGRNPYFPLLRYRTGDRAALDFRQGQPYLSSFEGRGAVQLQTSGGRTVPTLDVVNALRSLPVIGFSLEQSGAGAVSFSYAGQVGEESVRLPLEELFEGKVTVSQLDSWTGKPHRFSRSG